MCIICLVIVRMRLEKEAEELTRSGQTESDRLMDVYDRLEQLDSASAETKAAHILHGLGQCLHCYIVYVLGCTGLSKWLLTHRSQGQHV